MSLSKLRAKTALEPVAKRARTNSEASSSFTSVQTKTREEETGTLRRVRVDTLYEPLPHHLPSPTVNWVRFSSTDGQKFVGPLAQLTATTCYYAYEYELVVREDNHPIYGRSNFIVSVKDVTRLPLTGNLMSRLYMDFRSKDGASITPSIVDRHMQDFLDAMCRWGYLPALFNVEAEDIWAAFRKCDGNEPQPYYLPGIPISKFEHIAEKPMNPDIVELYAPFSWFINESPYFISSSEKYALLRAAYGASGWKFLPEHVVRDVLKTITNEPWLMFFKSLNPTRAPIFKKALIEQVKPATRNPMTVDQITIIMQYANFVSKMQYAFPQSSAMPRSHCDISNTIIRKLCEYAILTELTGPAMTDKASLVSYYMDAYTNEAELEVVSGLRELLTRNRDKIPWDLLRHEMIERLDHSQKRVFQSIRTNAVTILSGRPGFGKSEVMLTMIILLALLQHRRILVTTPTGRTLNDLYLRCEKMLMKLGATDLLISLGERIDNIENLIMGMPSNKGAIVIRTTASVIYDLRMLPEQPLRIGRVFNMLCIEESSMLDIETMYKLTLSVGGHTRLFLNGDANQLDPVNAIGIMPHLIEYAKSDVPDFKFIELEQCHRVDPDSLLIVRNLDKMLEGRTDFENVSDITMTTAWSHVPCENVQGVLPTIEAIRKKHNWNVVQLFENIGVIAYFNEDVDEGNKAVFETYFTDVPNWEELNKPSGCFTINERICVKGGKIFTDDGLPLPTNTVCTIISIEHVEGNIRNAELADLIAARKVTWSSTDRVTFKTWRHSRIRVSIYGRLRWVNLITIQPENLCRAYFGTTYFFQGSSVHTAIVYQTTKKELQRIQIPVKDTYTASSRPEKQVVITGDVAFFIERVKKHTAPLIYSLFPHRLRTMLHPSVVVTDSVW